MQKDLSFIFEQKPMQWGLRGDPYLWDEMQELCVGKSLDIQGDEVAKFVCEYFKEVTGKTLAYDAKIYIKIGTWRYVLWNSKWKILDYKRNTVTH